LFQIVEQARENEINFKFSERSNDSPKVNRGTSERK